MGALGLVLCACGGSSGSTHETSTSTGSGGRSGSGGAGSTVWLCMPGVHPDPCDAPLTTTVVTASGARSVEALHAAADPPADCFYVYPTVSNEPGRNSNLVVQPAEVAAAVAEASPFSQVCRVWAPMYRQETKQDLQGAGNTINDDVAAEDVAYAGVLSAWKDYLADYNDGRPVVFLGHSQGAAMLIRLLESEVDPVPSVRRRMVSAIILGGNVQVPDGAEVGGTFREIPACTSETQTGCVIAYSSFDARPPANTLFGRPGQGVSLQSNQTESVGMQVLCTNPAALGGGPGALDPSFYARGKSVVGETITTPWAAYPGRYEASCESAGGATWLQVTPVPADPRPVVTPTLGPRWGLHAYDVNLAMGDLVGDVASQEAVLGH